MTSHLTYVIAQERIADLQRAAHQAQLVPALKSPRSPEHNRVPIARLIPRRFLRQAAT
jgi:hypothetical protein